MRIEPRNLGASAQAQIATKVAHQRQRERKAALTRYEVELPDGRVQRFASTKQADHCRELLKLERAGKICDLRIGTRYILIQPTQRSDGTFSRPESYKVDFDYWVPVYREPEGNRAEIMGLWATVRVDEYGSQGLGYMPILPGEECYNGIHYGVRSGKWTAWQMIHVAEDVGYHTKADKKLTEIRRKLMLERYGIEVQEL